MLNLTPLTSRTRWQALIALLAVALVAAACGSGTDEAAESKDASATSAVVADDPATDDGSESSELDSEESDDSASSETDESDDTDDPADADSEGTSQRSRLGDRIQVADLSATSGRFEGTISIAGDADLPDGLELGFSGSFDSVNNASEVVIDFAEVALAAAAQDGTDLGPMAALFEEPMIVRTIGDQSYISWGLFSLLTGGQGTWIQTDAEESGDFTSSFGASGNGSPVDLISALEDANADITELGSEQVRGVDTTHILAVVDLEELGENLSEEERATLERDIGGVENSAFPIEFWIDDDGLLRRYSMDISQSTQSGGDLQQGSLVFEFFDYGEDITIDAPPADEVISSDELDLGALGFGN